MDEKRVELGNDDKWGRIIRDHSCFPSCTETQRHCYSLERVGSEEGEELKGV
jgi:hypothetical protein